MTDDERDELVARILAGGFWQGDFHMSTSHGGKWTDERAAMAVQLYTVDGYSATRIAGVLGMGLTRNAVIGKLHRMGVSTDRMPTQRMKLKCKARSLETSKQAVKSPTYRFGGGKKSDAPTFDATPLPMPRADDVGRIAFAASEQHHCLWIVGDDKPAMCCGLQRVPGKSYCSGHAARSMPANVTPAKRPYWSDGSDYSNKARFRKGKASAEA